jgi:hypothetical protein
MILLPVCVGCGTFGYEPGSPEAILASLSGDVEIQGQGTAVWPEGSVPEEPNFVWDYETVGYRRGSERPFHRMKTTLRLRYDPDQRRVTSASVTASENGGSFRHVCLTPGPNGILMIRMSTLLDNRGRDRTVVKVHGPDPSTHSCEDIGVGPADGLMEGLDVIFNDDGTFAVHPGSNAYLAGSGLRLERIATLSPDPKDVHLVKLPR